MAQASHNNDTGRVRAPNTQTPEWQAAVAAGLDMSLVELSLAKSFGERIRDHDSALAFALSLAPAQRR